MRKSRGLALRKARGPWAPRRLAVCQNARNTGQLSETCDCASHVPNFAVSKPLIRTAPAANPLHVQDIAPIPSPKPSPTAPDADASRGNNDDAASKPAFSAPVLSSAIIPLGPVKRAPPTHAVDVLRGSANTTLAKAACPSPVASPAPTPSIPFTLPVPSIPLVGDRVSAFPKG